MPLATSRTKRNSREGTFLESDFPALQKELQVNVVVVVVCVCAHACVCARTHVCACAMVNTYVCTCAKQDNEFIVTHGGTRDVRYFLRSPYGINSITIIFYMIWRNEHTLDYLILLFHHQSCRYSRCIFSFDFAITCI